MQEQAVHLLLNAATASFKSRATKTARAAYGEFAQNFVRRPAYIQKLWRFVLFWPPRVSDRNPALTVRTRDIKVFRRVA